MWQLHIEKGCINFKCSVSKRSYRILLQASLCVTSVVVVSLRHLKIYLKGRMPEKEQEREIGTQPLPAGPLCKCLPQPGPVQAKPRARNLLWVCHACQRTRPRALHCHLPGTLAGCWMEGGWLNPCAMRPVPLVMSRPAGRLCLTLQASCVVGSCLVTGVHPIILNGPLSSQFSDRLGWGQMLCLCR